MQALFNLIQSLAKEEKRLYNLHGRKSRFTQIYKGYLQAQEYSKILDRTLYSKHFSSFSKAFYSMQKNALLDDILAVLLEYSNSSRDDFIINRYKAKYEVLNYKGFHEQALTYIRAALDACEKISSPRLQLRILEDFRDTLARASTGGWEEYAEILRRIESTSQMVAETAPFDENRKKLNVLVHSTVENPSESQSYKEISTEILESIQDFASEKEVPKIAREAFQSEFLYSKTFEDDFELHARLVRLEKHSVKENLPADIRLQIINLLMESSMVVGDFLLINGLIYKTQRRLTELSEQQRRDFLPKYLELCGIYHFYENDLPLAQREFSELMEMEHLPEEMQIRIHFHMLGALIAANLSKTAQELLEKVITKFPKLKQEISVKLLELIIYIEMNKREESLVKLQRLKSHIRRNKDARKLSHIRQFLEMLQKILDRKRVSFVEISALSTDWMDLVKLNLWLKSKIENQFYYNNILNYWQGRKKVVNV